MLVTSSSTDSFSDAPSFFISVTFPLPNTLLKSLYASTNLLPFSSSSVSLYVGVYILLRFTLLLALQPLKQKLIVDDIKVTINVSAVDFFNNFLIIVNLILYSVIPNHYLFRFFVYPFFVYSNCE